MTIVNPLDEISSQNLRQYAGKLLLQNEIPPELTFHFTKIPSIKRKLTRNECQRCGNQKRVLFGTIPCAKCQQSHLYCRNCVAMGRVMECEPLYFWEVEDTNWTSYDSPLSWKGTLTNAQQRASDQLVSTIQEGKKEFLIWAV
ncbi:hypothetical protein [Paucisalibacillus globulus]|uniref:hypothetical protein n=1 Tax=Paucisalibacillus globulus TaxID=351095 RepID=UPI000BB84E06|nr:hypothetical protein [Paucisalibacillus globulus]